MDVGLMSIEMKRFLYQCGELAEQKNRDYHPDRIAMLEILQTACDTGVTVEQDLWGRVRKQMSALRRYVIDGVLESESPQSRMTDVAVYMAIMAFWVNHRLQVLEDVRRFVRSTNCERNGLNPCGTEVDICDRCRFLFWLNEGMARAH